MKQAIKDENELFLHTKEYVIEVNNLEPFFLIATMLLSYLSS